MRIPHTIPDSVLRVYEPSAEASELKGGEEARTVRAENFGWDTAEGAEVPHSLVHWCLVAIEQNFERKPILEGLPLCNRDYLLELLSTELPLKLTVPKVPESVYWRRCCENKWDSMNFIQDYGNSWKRMYLERYLQEHLEQIPVEDYKMAEVTSLTKLLSPYVRRLRLVEMQLIKSQQELDAVTLAELKAEKKKEQEEEEIAHIEPVAKPKKRSRPSSVASSKSGKSGKRGKGALGAKGKDKKGKEETPPEPEVPPPRPLTPPGPEEPPPEQPDPCVPRHDIPLDHINLAPVLKNLEHLQEFSVTFGVQNCGMDYRQELFQFSVQDMKNIGRGLASAFDLRVFRMTRSNLDDSLSPDLVRGLAKLVRLKELDISHCRVGDNTACALGHLITEHPRIEVLNLTNNCIGERGVKGLAYALQHPPCAPLRELRLRLNRVADGGAAALAAMLERARLPTTLVLAACDISGEGAKHLAAALRRNHTLRHLDLSNNSLGERGGQHLESAMKVNTTLIDLDVRMSQIPAFREYVIMFEVETNKNKYRRLCTDIKDVLKEEVDEQFVKKLRADARAKQRALDEEERRRRKRESKVEEAAKRSEITSTDSGKTSFSYQKGNIFWGM